MALTGPFADVAVLIVGFGNAADIVQCLRALAAADADPAFSVHIVENGGAEAFDHLIAALSSQGGPCTAEDFDAQAPSAEGALRSVHLRLVRPDGAPATRVFAAEMAANLGYAGGLNACLKPLQTTPGWGGVWILNPDTTPRPDALKALTGYAAAHGKGLIGGRIVYMSEPDRIQTRGLRWRKLRASPAAIDHRTIATDVDPERVEKLMDAPAGASVYATRPLLERIGLMREDYFLYFEDLEWGLRARDIDAIGYAGDAVVAHVGSTTIGNSGKRRRKSKLSVYLEMRNRILFVRDRFPGWVLWTATISVAEILVFLGLGALTNARVGVRGLLAGLADERGMPPWMSKT